MSSPFNGVWDISMDESREWHADKGQWLPDHVEREVVTIAVEGKRYDFSLEVGVNPVVHLSYSAELDGDWVPYVCTAMDYPKELERAEKLDPRTPGANIPENKVGEPIAYVKMIEVSPTMHVRISRHPDGQTLQYTMTSEMISDNRRVTRVTSADGVPLIYRVAERIEP